MAIFPPALEKQSVCCSVSSLTLRAVRHRGAGAGVQRRQVVSHHAGAVLRPHLQTLRLPEGQPVAPGAAAEGERRRRQLSAGQHVSLADRNIRQRVYSLFIIVVPVCR